MRKALVVGINDYPKSPLTGCLNDALAVKELLAKNENGTPNFNLTAQEVSHFYKWEMNCANLF